MDLKRGYAAIKIIQAGSLELKKTFSGCYCQGRMSLIKMDLE